MQSVKMNLFKKNMNLMNELTKGIKHLFLITILSSMAYTALNALVPQVVRITVDSIVGEEAFAVPLFISDILYDLGGRDYFRQNLMICGILIVVIAVLSQLFNFISEATNSYASEKFMLVTRNKLYRHIQFLPYSWHVKHNSGDIIQRCTSDTEVLRRFITAQAVQFVKTMFLIIFSIGIMWYMNPLFVWIPIFFMPIIIIYTAFFFKKVRVIFKEADEKEGELSDVVMENLTGVRVVRAFAREKFELERFDEKNDGFADAWIKLGKVNGVFWGVSDIFTNIQMLAVIVYGAYLGVNGNITAGDFIAFVSYNAALNWPIRQLGRIIVDMSKAFVSIERLNYILDTKEEICPKNPISPEIKGNIEFKNVSFSYDVKSENKEIVENKLILKNINFTIKAGQTVGILGSTGSGKSTLMHLVNKLYTLKDGEGEILIEGVNINDIENDYLRKNIALNLQEPYLYSKSIRENIGIIEKEYSDDKVKEVAKVACIDDSIMKFKNKYETVIGEKGVTLSGGQRQRVAIARSLMQNAPIMIFDDSLSAVDTETDISIRNNLRKTTNNKEKTVVLISHRITTLMSCDNIIVMDNAQIVQEGTHNELINQDGMYKEIYDIQMNLEEFELDQNETENNPSEGGHACRI